MNDVAYFFTSRLRWHVGDFRRCGPINVNCNFFKGWSLGSRLAPSPDEHNKVVDQGNAF